MNETKIENETRTELKSERELLTTRSFNAPARIVFEAWTKPELMQRWWVPKSMGMTLLSCEMDVRVGGKYRFQFENPSGAEPIAFFGTYKEVVPNARLVWTNEESPDGSVTTVTFEEKDGRTTLLMHELFPSKEALDANGGMENALPETFRQLDELLASL
jgi:uncharacterized protein YndB with AHSA1/START domain